MHTRTQWAPGKIAEAKAEARKRALRAHVRSARQRQSGRADLEEWTCLLARVDACKKGERMTPMLQWVAAATPKDKRAGHWECPRQPGTCPERSLYTGVNWVPPQMPGEAPDEVEDDEVCTAEDEDQHADGDDGDEEDGVGGGGQDEDEDEEDEDEDDDAADGKDGEEDEDQE